MKYLFVFFLIISSACNKKEQPKITPIQQNPNDILAIKKVLISQQECWNKGDIEGFMQGYWHSDKLSFSSTNSTTYGWENTLNQYKKNYNTPDKMGTLHFVISGISLTSDSTATLDGKWKLERKKDSPHGNFTLTLQKINQQWLITKDFTTNE